MQSGKQVRVFISHSDNVWSVDFRARASGSNMSEKSVRESQSLCAGERDFVDQRKKKILESLKKLDVKCTEDSVPHIALLGSGGGQRAAVGLLGSLCQMDENKLLDSVLYLGGVSGSTWCMVLLYTVAKWRMDKAIELMSSEVNVVEAMNWLKKRAQDEDFSLTDIWGLMTTAGLMNQLELKLLSDQVNKNPNNPYPIYCAIEKNCFNNQQKAGQWFEMSPHEAGFTELGLFVETSLLGSKFCERKLVDEKPEMDMIKLQGILGSALASEETNKEYILQWLNDPLNTLSRAYQRIVNSWYKVINLFREIYKDRATLVQLDDLRRLLADKDKAHQEEHPEHESKSDEEKKSIFLKWSEQVKDVVMTWCQDVNATDVKDFFMFITTKVIPLIVKWEWGTTDNFLYEPKDSSAQENLTTLENINLMDAGILMNLPFPSFLGDKRDIDLIIALDFSEDEIFKTLTLAEKYAEELKKPFPEIDPEIPKQVSFPKDCYVIEGKGKGPTIVYLPLFNQRNCETQEVYDANMLKLTAFQGPLSKDQTEELLKTAKENISNNSALLLEEIKKAADRRQKK